MSERRRSSSRKASRTGKPLRVVALGKRSTGATVRTAAPAIYAALKEMILSFELYPGARFTESELAARFGVSRTPIREALQRLETEHYVTVRPKQGCFVRDVDIDALTQRYQVRIELELLSVQLACLHMSDQELLRLADEWNPDLKKGHSTNPDIMNAKDESFHQALAGGGGNQALHDYIADINHHIRVVRRLDFTSDKRIDRTFEEHYEIVERLLRRDLPAAQHLMREHIIGSMEFAKTLTLMELQRKRPRAVLAG